jgi:hypothetical protein
MCLPDSASSGIGAADPIGLLFWPDGVCWVSDTVLTNPIPTAANTSTPAFPRVRRA